MEVDGKEYELSIHDEGGTSEYNVAAEVALRDADAVLFVYSIIDRRSFFDDILGRYSLLDRFCRVREFDREKVRYPMVLVGAKVDLEHGDPEHTSNYRKAEREVQLSEAIDFARKYDMPFFETSAKANINVREAIEELVREVVKYKAKGSPPPHVAGSGESAEKNKEKCGMM